MTRTQTVILNVFQDLFKKCRRQTSFAILLALCGCAGTNSFVQSHDLNQDGLKEKRSVVRDGKLIREDHDRNHDGQVDQRVFYNDQRVVTAVENDTNGDGQMDSRDEFYEDFRSLSFRDKDHDGTYDRSWTTYYNDNGEKEYVESDLNNDGYMDSRFKMNDNLRENLVNGKWYVDEVQDGQHGIRIAGIWYATKFKNGVWVIDDGY